MFAIHFAVFLVVYVALLFILPTPFVLQPAVTAETALRLRPAVIFEPTSCIRSMAMPTVISLTSNSISPFPFILATFIVALVAILLILQRRDQLAKAADLESAPRFIPPFSPSSSSSSSHTSFSSLFSRSVLASPFVIQCATVFCDVKTVVASDPTLVALVWLLRTFKMIAFASLALGASQIPTVCACLWDILSDFDMVVVFSIARTVRLLGRVVYDLDGVVVDCIVTVASWFPRGHWTVCDYIVPMANDIGASLLARCEWVDRVLVSIEVWYANLSVHPIFPAFWSLLSNVEVVVFSHVWLAACWLSAGGIGLWRCWYAMENKTDIIISRLSVQVRLAQSHLKCSIHVYVACVGSLVLCTQQTSEREAALSRLTLSPSLQSILDLLPTTDSQESLSTEDEDISDDESSCSSPSPSYQSLLLSPGSQELSLSRDDESFLSSPSSSLPFLQSSSVANSQDSVEHEDASALPSAADQSLLSSTDSELLENSSDDSYLPSSPSPTFNFSPSSSSSPWSQSHLSSDDKSFVSSPPSSPQLPSSCLFSAAEPIDDDDFFASLPPLSDEFFSNNYDSDDDRDLIASILSPSNVSLLSTSESLRSLSSEADDDDSFDALPSHGAFPLSPSTAPSPPQRSTQPDDEPSSQEDEDVELAKHLPMRMDNWLASSTSFPLLLDECEPPMETAEEEVKEPNMDEDDIFLSMMRVVFDMRIIPSAEDLLDPDYHPLPTPSLSSITASVKRGIRRNRNTLDTSVVSPSGRLVRRARKPTMGSPRNPLWRC